jgi:hypothetical protein
MTPKQREHKNLTIATLLIVHLLTSYIEGSINPFEFSKGMRECEVIMIIITQVFAHYCWINKEKIIKELRDE